MLVEERIVTNAQTNHHVDVDAWSYAGKHLPFPVPSWPSWGRRRGNPPSPSRRRKSRNPGS